MTISFSKYHGTGNDFILIDAYHHPIPILTQEQIKLLCDRRYGIGADGLIFICKSEQVDFKMVYYNADGAESTMCGNGGRCITSFANRLKIVQSEATFEAIDGLHHSWIEDGRVRLQMIDTVRVEAKGEKTYFIDTGSPHVIEVVDSVDLTDVVTLGASIRYADEYTTIGGSNVNFIELGHPIKVRTYERGVEDETLSCGTGVTAVALTILQQYPAYAQNNKVEMHTPGGLLNVEAQLGDHGFSDIFLIGPTVHVYDGHIELK